MSTSSSSSSSSSAAPGSCPSRLDRLFTLLSASSGEATRTLAGRQLAAIAAERPQDADILMERLHPLVVDGKWDTRISACRAVGEILKSVGDEIPAGGEDRAALMTFGDLSAERLVGGDALSASQEAEFDDGESDDLSAAEQRKAINKTFGLDVIGSEDLVTDDDVKQLSARERNRLKKRAKSHHQQQEEQSQQEAKRAKMSASAAKAKLFKVRNEDDDSMKASWFLGDLCSLLKDGLSSARWETRHGSATALREAARWQGRRSMSREYAVDLALRLVAVAARDRFGDFVSDQVVAPVRESAAQALGATADLLPAEDVLSLCHALVSLLGSADWQCRHGGLLGIKYVFAARRDMSLGGILLREIYPAVFERIQNDDVDDVVGVAAAALVPVASAVVFGGDIDPAPLVARLWESLKSFDELNSATHSVLRLLSELVSLGSDGGATAAVVGGEAPELVKRLFPFASHSSSQVRRSALGALKTMASKADLASNFLPQVCADLMPLLLKRSLVETKEDILSLVEEVWNVSCDNTDLSALLMGTCPLYGSWVDAASQQTVDSVSCRLAAARMLGKLAAFVVQPVPGLDYSREDSDPLSIFVTKILVPNLITRSAYRRTAISLVIANWMGDDEDAAGRNLPDDLVRLLHGCMTESVVYEEAMPPFTEARADAAELFAAVREQNLPVPAAVVEAGPAHGLDLVQLKAAVVDESFEQLFANTRVKASIVRDLIERKERLATRVRAVLREQERLSVMSLAASAAAVVCSGALPDRLGSVIRPLMEAIKREREPRLQSLAADHLARLLHAASASPAAEKVVGNLAVFLSSDPQDSPPFLADPADPANARIFATQMWAGNNRAAADDREGAEGPLAAARVQSRGARAAFEASVRRFGPSVFDCLPRLRELTTEWPTKCPQDVGICLSVLEASLGGDLAPSLFPSVERLVPDLVSSLRSPHSNVRHLASRCLARLAAVRADAVVSGAVADSVVPMLDEASANARRGAMECVAMIVDGLGADVVPHIVPFVLPVLARMSDADEEVRLLASNTFATLINLVPLDGLGGGGEGDDGKLAEQRMFLEQLMGTRKVEDNPVPPEVTADLREYQLAGVNWLSFLDRFGLHGVLCDDMGLGKTLQTICLLAAHHRRNVGARSLVVCPPTLCGHWCSEMERFLEGGGALLRPLVYSGPQSTRTELRARFASHYVIICSYDVMRNDSDFLCSTHWSYVVLDEGHLCKNPRSKTTAAAKRLRASRRLILSGTPIQNSVLELWSLFDFLMPGFLGTEKQFSARFGRPILAGREAKNAETGALAMEALHKQVLPFILRRLKKQVLKDLPPKIMQDYYCDLSPMQTRLYEDFAARQRSSGAGAGHVFQALQYLRMVCDHPKLVLDSSHTRYADVQQMLRSSGAASSMGDISHSGKLPALRDLLLQCGIGGGGSGGGDGGSVVLQHRALVFFQLKAMMDIVEADLLKATMPGVTYLRLDGSVPPGARQSIVDRFNGDPSVDLLLLTTSVGGMGLNLTGADTVIFVEHDWNPTKDLQAMDRAHRIGQTKVVTVYRLLCRNSIEEKIMGLQEFKTRTAGAVISADNSNLRTMATERIVDLFSLGSGAPPPTSSSSSQSGKGRGGLRALLEHIPELWDESEYDREFDVGAFVSGQSASKSDKQ